MLGNQFSIYITAKADCDAERLDLRIDILKIRKNVYL